MDSYQAIYDATRSKIGSCDTGSIIERAAREAFDTGMAIPLLQEAIREVANEIQRPSVLYRPTISADGMEWCALLGEDLMTGVCGFGKTPAEAMAAFDRAFWKGATPAATRAADAVRPGA